MIVSGIVGVPTNFSPERKARVSAEVKISLPVTLPAKWSVTRGNKRALALLFIQDNGASYLAPALLLRKLRNN